MKVFRIIRTAQTGDIRIEHYGTRNWAVYMSGELICVTVYLKGAMKVKEIIEELLADKRKCEE